MCRPQFTLRALLVAMLVIAAFFGGMAAQKQLDKPAIRAYDVGSVELILPDGTRWWLAPTKREEDGQD
jgi:hypothetical protein